jgi:mono/diheme cytochrome c family protein
MRKNHIKLLAVIFFALPLLLLTMFKGTPVKVAASTFDDPAATFKAKCAACHTPTASKFYDPAHSDEVHVQTILKGKKGEKPPYMPAFGEKGMTQAEAEGLAAYMKTLKPPTN